jgi:hypothetical protein
MKKKLLILAGIGCIAVVTYIYAATQVKNTGAGYQIGTAKTQLLGFWGVAPTTQPTVVRLPVTITLTNGDTGGQLVPAVTNLISVLSNLCNALNLSGIILTNGP